jgi:hypothetical protein
MIKMFVANKSFNLLTSVKVALIVFLFILSSCLTYQPPLQHHRTIQFSGLTWFVKEASELVGPGPNFFGSGSDQVWVDSKGFLHLKIREKNGVWYCAEVFSQRKFSNGRFTFQLASRVDNLDSRVVAGLFTWNTHPRAYHQEVDVEFSRWGNPDDGNAQFVVQPYSRAKNIHRFQIELKGDYSTHEFTTGRDFVFFESYHGHVEKSYPGGTINSWLYNSTQGPRIRNAEIRINLWLVDGMPPTNQREAEIIIRKVTYIPISSLQS